MPSGLKLFPLFGQSNLTGHGLLSELPAGHPAFGSRIWNYKFDGTWQNPAADPLHDETNSVYPIFDIDADYQVGPGLFFADHFARYAPPSWEIGLVPCGRGAHNMSALARPADGVDTTTIYGAARARWEAAAASGTIEGVILYQGEADTGSTALANAWAGKFTQFVADIRSDTGKPNLPVVFVQIGPCSASFLAARPDYPLLQTNQSKMVNINRCVMVPNLDTTLKPGDDVHLDTAGMKVVGQRCADAMRVLGAGY